MPKLTGVAELSQTDDVSWDVRADNVPEGFNVIQSQHGIEFTVHLATSPWSPNPSPSGELA